MYACHAGSWQTGQGCANTCGGRLVFFALQCCGWHGQRVNGVERVVVFVDDRGAYTLRWAEMRFDCAGGQQLGAQYDASLGGIAKSSTARGGDDFLDGSVGGGHAVTESDPVEFGQVGRELCCPNDVGSLACLVQG